MSAGQLPPPGTVLRKYDRNGAVRCEAVVAENGQVVYRGVVYPSISAAARVAAGDIGLAARSCDGYAFFGLKGRDGATPRAPRPAVALPLPLPVRWDDLPTPQAPPQENALGAWSRIILASGTQPAPVDAQPQASASLSTRPQENDGDPWTPLVLGATRSAGCLPFCNEFSDGVRHLKWCPNAVGDTHSAHGRANESGAPLDPDCPCCGGALEQACAEAGCGFCRAARSEHLAAAMIDVVPAPVPVEQPITPASALALANIDPRLALAAVAAAPSVSIDATLRTYEQAKAEVQQLVAEGGNTPAVTREVSADMARAIEDAVDKEREARVAERERAVTAVKDQYEGLMAVLQDALERIVDGNLIGLQMWDRLREYPGLATLIDALRATVDTGRRLSDVMKKELLASTEQLRALQSATRRLVSTMDQALHSSPSDSWPLVAEAHAALDECRRLLPPGDGKGVV